MLCDVWTLARNARKLAFHPCARGRTTVVGILCWPSSAPTSSMPVGSPISSPAAGPHGALLDGSLLSTPWTVTSASLLLLRGRRRPPRIASAAYAYDTRIGSPPASPATVHREKVTTFYLHHSSCELPIRTRTRTQTAARAPGAARAGPRSSRPVVSATSARSESRRRCPHCAASRGWGCLWITVP